jgi:hypothetical protein
MSPPDDAELEALLWEGLKRPPLRDGGFTAQVLEALPRRPPFRHYRLLVGLGWAGAASGLSVALWAGCFGSGEASAASVISSAWLGFALVAMLMSCLGAWYAFDSASRA